MIRLWHYQNLNIMIYYILKINTMLIWKATIKIMNNLWLEFFVEEKQILDIVALVKVDV